ncbi:uncharacterized protein KGF55_003501 [Candida pseudojiufengensis]|uniref:uncharacterized protein n=1 Tax=Candida pseudojiufengensis TaxID=497109 RepID=UPI002224BDC9|nr:uncharacterized protein KGF55_003501 [Candida pseudojiufengensis]KAI5962425.1 hypothetical protein KGF55_003501 [Candida pseudojiufengensis]
MALCPKPLSFEKNINAATNSHLLTRTNKSGNTKSSNINNKNITTTSNNKRGCEYSYPSTTSNKRICLQQLRKNNSNNLPSNYYSSSSEEDDSEDEQSCYYADQMRAKRRASSRISFSLNPELSKAISQYSDDEDEEIEQQQYYNNKKSIICPRRSSDSSIKLMKSDEEHENLDCKFTSSPIGSNLSLKKMLVQNNNNNTDDEYDYDDEEDLFESDSNIQSVAIADKNARSRCFEYLIGAIDEAWARYCDATTYVEDEVHGYITPASMASDDEDKELMNLKQRLINAKNFLQDHIDSFDLQEIKKFWNRWDISKYEMLEVMEDEDELLEKLEAGRFN